MSFTIPNLLSLLRMGLVPLLVLCILDGRMGQALVIIAIAGVTDLLDGLIARYWNQQSKLGTYLDPIADKLLLVSAYITLAIPGLAPGLRIPVWVTTLVLTRDVLILLVALLIHLAWGISEFPPAKISKVTTFFQVAGGLLVILARLQPALENLALGVLYAAAALTVISGLNYLVLANRMAGSASAGSDKAP